MKFRNDFYNGWYWRLGKFFYISSGMGVTWFRFFGGWGLQIKGKEVEPLFSERYGYRKYLKIFGFRIGILKPYNN